jgi:N-acyl-D-aspartate/D-glutamate deacylase
MHDLIIKNSTIIDGTGISSFHGDIAIKDSKIVQLGAIDDSAERTIDGKGFISCPGFIDPHNHIDITLPLFPFCTNFVMQGITTAVGGNCGMSGAPKKGLTFEKFLSNLDKKGISINYIPLVGHSTLREFVMGDDFKRLATPEEIESMKLEVEKAMQNGVHGFSTMRDPSAGEYANTDEIIELVKVAAKYGGIYATHHRHIQSQWSTQDLEEYSYGLFHGPTENVWVGRYRGLLEAFEIGKKANIPVHVSHLSNVYRIPQPHPDFLDEAAARATLWNVEKAIEEGVDVTFDVIPNTSSISASNPLIDEFLVTRVKALEWLKEFKEEDFINSLKNSEFREKIKQISKNGRLKLGMINTKADPYWMDRFLVLKCRKRSIENKKIGEIANSQNKDALDVIFDIIIEDSEAEWVQIDDDRLQEKCVPILLQHPLAMPCTDTFALPPFDFPEKALKMFPAEYKKYLYVPIFYGMFADYIGRHVRKNGILTLEEAIKKATSLPAQRFGLRNRGIIKPDYFADIVIFDYDKINIKGDFKHPRQAPDGIHYVIVNGQITFEEKEHTKKKAGKVLRHEI